MPKHKTVFWLGALEAFAYDEQPRQALDVFEQLEGHAMKPRERVRAWMAVARAHVVKGSRGEARALWRKVLSKSRESFRYFGPRHVAEAYLALTKHEIRTTQRRLRKLPPSPTDVRRLHPDILKLGTLHARLLDIDAFGAWEVTHRAYVSACALEQDLAQHIQQNYPGRFWREVSASLGDQAVVCKSRLKSKPSVEAILATTLWSSRKDRVQARVRALEATVALDIFLMGVPVMGALGAKARPKHMKVRALLDELLSGKPRKDASDTLHTHLVGLDAGLRSASTQRGKMRCKAPNSVGPGEKATLVCPAVRGSIHVQVCRDEAAQRCVLVFHGEHQPSVGWELPKSWRMDHAFLHVRRGGHAEKHLLEVRAAAQGRSK